jgi:hypothetical protein
MRENRTYGSEGGEGKPFPTPISTPQLCRDGKTVPQPGTGITGSPAFAGDAEPRWHRQAGLS